MTELEKELDVKLEVVFIAVADVDRAKAFYEKLGWRLDIDVVVGDFRGVQMTPPNSATSIIFGKGITSAKPGSSNNLVLAVADIDAVRKALVTRGVEVSEIFHYAAGPFNNTVPNPRVNGRDPEGRSYFTFASFEDPDGNSWLLQEITARLPGREWQSAQSATDVPALAELLRETGHAHDRFEKSHAKHEWWDWYAPYLSARQNGSTSEEAAASADRYMEDVMHVLPL